MNGPERQSSASRVLVVDDHGLVREGLLALFRAEQNLEVLAVDSGAAIRTARYFVPHVVLMDVTLPGNFAFLAAQSIREANHAARVLFLDDTVRPANVEKALRLGAAGYWTKHTSFDLLVEAVHCAAGGGNSFCPEVEQHLAVTPKGTWYNPPREVTAVTTLTERERDVLTLLARGFSVKQCAERLKLSPSTIDNHRTRLMKKLGVHRVVDRVWVALREGLAGE